jgi:adenylate cyclase
MVSSRQVIDIGADPLAERNRRRRAWLRIGVPVAGVVLMVAAILFIAVYSDRANREGVLALSDDVLSGLDSRIALEVAAYLDPAARDLRILRGMMKDEPLALPSETQANAATVLQEFPQIANLSFADQDGNYILIRRGPAGGTEAKIIDNAPGARRVTWIYRNAAGSETGRKEDPSDKFDPRIRPWYVGAVGTDDLFWTGTYIFFTDRKPGITVAGRYVGKDGRLFVYGVDISLNALSRFLASLQIGPHGRAVIINKAGELIASPSGSVMADPKNGNAGPAKIDQLGDPALTRAYDQFRADGAGRYMIDLQGQPYIVTGTPLATAGRDWLVLIAVPEKDFVGFVANSNRHALIMSLVIVVVAAALGILLVRQGLRSDRSARLLNERQQAIRRQSAAFARIAAEASLFDPAQNGPPSTLTETLVEATCGRRGAVWRLGAGGRTLICEDSYDRDSGGHISGLELHRDELPRFIAALLKGEEFMLPDATRDRQAAEFHGAFMAPFGSQTLLAVPVRREGQTVGLVTVEDPLGGSAHLIHAGDFVRALGNMLVLRMTQAPATRSREPAAPSHIRVEEAALRSFSADLKTEGIDPAAVDAGIFPDVAVMVLQLTDAAAMALRPAGATGNGRSLSHEIVRRAQQVADEHQIPYLKLVGHELYAAAGFGGGSEGAPAHIADVALAVRDCCMALFEDNDRALSFRIGIDCGLAIGCALGAGPEIFNLWGEAVQTADTMATSALPGSVQVTEAAYQRLRRDFLFRPRGRFYLPRIGEAQTFILASRA